MTYPNEYNILDSFDNPLNLTKEDYRSTLKQETPPQEQINRTQETLEQYGIKSGYQLTMLCLKIDVLQFADLLKSLW